MTTTAADSAPGSTPPAELPEPVDENVWLEEIYGEEQLAWVKEQNSRTEDLLEDADYAGLEGASWRCWTPRTGSPWWASAGTGTTTSGRTGRTPRACGGAQPGRATARMPRVGRAAGRRCARCSGGRGVGVPRRHLPAARCRRAHRPALLALSPDGGDANRYREFDVESRGFVAPADGGFDLPTAKGNVSWLDADTLLVASTADGLPKTASSYARTAVTLGAATAGRAPAPVRGPRAPHAGGGGARLHTGLRADLRR